MILQSMADSAEALPVSLNALEEPKSTNLTVEGNLLDDTQVTSIEVQDAIRIHEEQERQNKEASHHHSISGELFVTPVSDNADVNAVLFSHASLLVDNFSDYQTNRSVNLSTYDLKDEESKFRRWTPKLDLYLVKLLSDVVHSFKKPENAELSKRAWHYITGLLRNANPQTVYATYTKYSILQHLFNVIHARYRMWHALMEFRRSTHAQVDYSYRWKPELGKFQIFETSSNSIIIPDRQIKSVLFGDSFPLPQFKQFHKSGLVLNDLFLTNNLKYMSVYHNEVLPMLVRLDSRYSENLPPLFSTVPKFHYDEEELPFFKPLALPKPKQDITKERFKNRIARKRDHISMEQLDSVISEFTPELSNMNNDNGAAAAVAAASAAINVNTNMNQKYAGTATSIESERESSIDPTVKTDENTERTTPIKASPGIEIHEDSESENLTSHTSDFENDLANAAIAAISSPQETLSRDPTGYIKDRIWLCRLLSLCDRGLISVNEVLTVCAGIRDGKIPAFMLNILDPGYLGGKSSNEDELSDAEIIKRIREFFLPLSYT